MKSLVILALGILLLSCSKNSPQQKQTKSGLTVSGVEYVDVNGRSTCELDLAEGERANLSFWIRFQQGSKSGSSRSDFIVERQHNELRLIVSGSGGSAIKWTSKEGETVSGSHTISKVNPPEEHVFEITLKQG